jgi:hypothetical protein
MKKPEATMKIYGHMKDGTPLTDASAETVVSEAFDRLEAGNGRVLKSPNKKTRIKTSVTKLPAELQQAAQYK